MEQLISDKNAKKSDWEQSVQKLVNANYRTVNARNYIQKFIQFEYRNWTTVKSSQMSDADTTQSTSSTDIPVNYKSYILKVKYRPSFILDFIKFIRYL